MLAIRRAREEPSEEAAEPPAAGQAPGATAPPTSPGSAPLAARRGRTATAELTVIGLGRPDPSASAYIAEIQRRLARQQRVRYRMHAMGTELEGTTEDILALVAELHRVPFDLGLPRAYTVLKLDERTDKQQTLEGKVSSVEERLGRE